MGSDVAIGAELRRADAPHGLRCRQGQRGGGAEGAGPAGHQVASTFENEATEELPLSALLLAGLVCRKCRGPGVSQDRARHDLETRKTADLPFRRHASVPSRARGVTPHSRSSTSTTFPTSLTFAFGSQMCV